MNWDILLQQVLNGLVLGSVYALVALGYTMVYGILQLINFAHGEVLMIGAMVGVTVVTYGFVDSTVPGWVQLLIALAAAVPVCVIVSLLMERLAYRPLRNAPRLSPLITAIGLSIVLQTLAMIIWSPSPRVFPDLLPTDPVRIGGAILGPKQLLILGVAATMMAGLVLLVNKTKLGRAMRATAENPLQHHPLLDGIHPRTQGLHRRGARRHRQHHRRDGGRPAARRDRGTGRGLHRRPDGGLPRQPLPGHLRLRCADHRPALPALGHHGGAGRGPGLTGEGADT
jgi:hypothetical protein